MPVFFLVGGYVNAQSWMARHAAGRPGPGGSATGPCACCGRRRCTSWWRSWRSMAARAAGAPVAEVAEAGWLVALQLWFLPVYMVLIALTPVMLAAHRRWGLAVPPSWPRRPAWWTSPSPAPHLHVIGYLNYLFVWGSIHQWGFAWQDRHPDVNKVATCTRWPRRRGPAGRPADVAVLHGRHGRLRQHQPAVDRAARVRRGPGGAGARGRARGSPLLARPARGSASGG